jgi:uncharacterized protein (TIGR02996 family)
MQNPDAAALMASIRRNKADDLPRFVYADWLEEHGQEERAAFIRKWIKMPHAPFTGAMIGAGDDWAYRMSGTRREDWRLVHESRRPVPYRFPLGTVVKLQPLTHRHKFATGQFSRGFIVEVAGPHDWFVANAAAIFRENPVERVTLTDMTSPAQMDARLTGPPIRRGLTAYLNAGLPDEISHVCVRFGEAMAEGRDYNDWAPDESSFHDPGLPVRVLSNVHWDTRLSRYPHPFLTRNRWPRRKWPTRSSWQPRT